MNRQTRASGTTAATTFAAGRDWSKIDTNRDSLVSPEEMEKFLSSAWAAHKTAGK